MKIDLPHRIAFLKKIHLFHGLDDDQVSAIANDLLEETFATDKEILEEGTSADRFCLIYAGTVCLTQKDQKMELGTLVAGDYFGEETLMGAQGIRARVAAREDTYLLSLDAEKFHSLLRKNPKLKLNFDVTIASERLARRKRFAWLEPEEVVYFLARKHSILLWQALTMPVLSLIIPVVLLIFASLAGPAVPGFVSTLAMILAGIFFLAILGLIVWRWIDWGNDYYIVTNQRVIWLEKVIGIYDSRQEAPLSTVLSVGVQTNQVGRWLDYGDVIIRTFVGKIIFHHVSHPNQAAALVEEQWNRAKTRSRRVDMDAMKLTIRQKLGLPVEQVASPEKSDGLVKDSPYKPSTLALFFSNIFKLRYEVGNTITYRKHWIVLVENVWQPTAIFLTGLAVIIWRAVDWIQVPASGAVDEPIITIIAVVLFPVFLWWLYQYIDWRNDIYQVTEDQILDVNKTPLGREERKVAPLENILSTSAQRIGFLQVLWNYGDVLITVGGTQLVFENLRDPVSVQLDIDRRRQAQVERKKQVAAAAERERVADWFVSYQESSEDLRKELEKHKLGGTKDDKVQ